MRDKARDMFAALKLDGAREALARPCRSSQRMPSPPAASALSVFAGAAARSTALLCWPSDLKAGVAYYGAQPPARRCRRSRPHCCCTMPGSTAASTPAFRPTGRAQGRRQALTRSTSIRTSTTPSTMIPATVTTSRPPIPAWSRTIAFFKRGTYRRAAEEPSLRKERSRQSARGPQQFSRRGRARRSTARRSAVPRRPPGSAD